MGKKKIRCFIHRKNDGFRLVLPKWVLIIIYEIEQQFVISASSTLLIINDLESSSLVSLSRLSGLVLQSINCTRRKRLAVQSRSCSVTPRCCLACSAACLARSFPCCLLLHAAAVLVSSPGWPSGYPAPLQPFSQEASLLKRLQSDRLRSYPSQSCYKAAVMLKSLLLACAGSLVLCWTAVPASSQLPNYGWKELLLVTHFSFPASSKAWSTP